MASFAVTTAGQKVSLDGQGGAQAQYTVTNMTSVPLKGRLLPVALNSASREWCSVAGDEVREFGPNGVERALVQIRIPGGTPPGTYSFRLDAVSEADPDEDFTEVLVRAHGFTLRDRWGARARRRPCSPG